MLLSPEQYAGASVEELLEAAARGHVGLDRRWLHALVGRGPRIAPDLLRFGLGDRERDLIDLGEELLHIFRHLRTPEALPFYVELVRRLEYDMPDELLEAFVDLGAASIDPLLELYDENDAPDVSFALAALGVRDARILELLLEELERWPLEAAISLGHYGDPAARPALEKKLAESEDPTVRREIQSALGEIGRAGEKEPPPAFDLWAQYPEEDLPQFALLEPQELAQFLLSPLADYRREAAEALASLEQTPEMGSQLFDLAQHDPEPGVRGAAWQALEGSGDERIRAAMQARLEEESAPLEERAGALLGLAQQAEEPAVRRRMLEFYERPATRAVALQAMWHSMDRRFGEYVPRHLDDPDLEVRRQAILATGWLGLTTQIGRIEKLLADKDAREAALFAYALAAPGETSPAHLRKLFRRIEELAGGLSHAEGHVVEDALDNRLALHGYEPVFTAGHGSEEPVQAEPPPAAPPASAKPGRNDPCPCGSGKKYKKCCGK